MESVISRAAYLFVLICGDGNEFRFFEHIRPERRVRQLEDVVGSDQMKPWLVLVHGVEYRLREGKIDFWNVIIKRCDR